MFSLRNSLIVIMNSFYLLPHELSPKAFLTKSLKNNNLIGNNSLISQMRTTTSSNSQLQSTTLHQTTENVNDNNNIDMNEIPFPTSTMKGCEDLHKDSFIGNEILPCRHKDYIRFIEWKRLTEIHNKMIKKTLWGENDDENDDENNDENDEEEKDQTNTDNNTQQNINEENKKNHLSINTENETHVTTQQLTSMSSPVQQQSHQMML